jgi:hypothetical protein
MGSICSTNEATISPLYFDPSTRNRSQQLTSIVSLEQMPEDAFTVLQELEMRGEAEAMKALQSSAPAANIADTLIEFMKSGADEYEKRTGRQMSYAEMRAAYG